MSANTPAASQAPYGDDRETAKWSRLSLITEENADVQQRADEIRRRQGVASSFSPCAMTFIAVQRRVPAPTAYDVSESSIGGRGLATLDPA
jgi:hypothetical protein